MPLISRWWLFSVFCLTSSIDKIEELCCNVIVGTLKGNRENTASIEKAFLVRIQTSDLISKDFHTLND